MISFIFAHKDLLDDDIADDLQCAQLIQQREGWEAWYDLYRTFTYLISEIKYNLKFSVL